jgi:uncharacterized membrane protein YraQ (UPF0718 family)
MQLSMLEITLISVLMTALGAIVAGVVLRILSDKRFVTQSECTARHASDKRSVTQSECAARHASDCQMSSQLIAKIDEMREGQEKFQESVDAKNSLVFRMLRSMVVYMDIPQEQKERILNERSGD